MITCFYFLILFIGLSHQDITPDVQISVQVPPVESLKRFPNDTINMYVQKGENMVLECVIFNMPQKGNIFWRKYPYKGDPKSPETINKGMTSYDLSRYRVGQGKEPDSIRLEIQTVDESYAGVYACEIMYSANVINAKAERTLMIYDVPEITYTEFKNKVEAGKDITFSCVAKGIPPPNVLWRRIGGISNIIKNTGVVLYSNDVTLNKVTHSDAGMYACYAVNEWGSSERKFALSVIHAPVVTITPNGNDAYQKVGCMIQLTCVVKADPAADSVAWVSSAAGTIKESDRFKLKTLVSSDQETFYILRIYPTTEADLTTVKYTCSASNYKGSASESVVFRVSSDPNPFLTGPYRCGALATAFSMAILMACVFGAILKVT